MIILPWPLQRAHHLAGRSLCIFAIALAAGTLDTASAQDCEIKEIRRSDTGEKFSARQNRNIKCLASRIDALGLMRDAMTRRIQKLEDDLSQTLAKYRNEDGAVDRDERYLGPATFVLSGNRQGRATSLELDHALILDMCADVDGCLLNLGLQGIVIGGDDVETIFAEGPCSFHLDRKTGTWALSGLCASADLPPPVTDVAVAGADPAWGRDGDAAPLGGPEQDARVILSFGGACFLAEGAPARRSAQRPETRFQRDTKRGLFLVAAGTEWDPSGTFPDDLLPMGLTDELLQCSLTVRD